MATRARGLVAIHIVDGFQSLFWCLHFSCSYQFTLFDTGAKTKALAALCSKGFVKQTAEKT